MGNVSGNSITSPHPQSPHWQLLSIESLEYVLTRVGSIVLVSEQHELEFESFTQHERVFSSADSLVEQQVLDPVLLLQHVADISCTDFCSQQQVAGFRIKAERKPDGTQRQPTTSQQAAICSFRILRTAENMEELRVIGWKHVEIVERRLAIVKTKSSVAKVKYSLG